MDAIVTPNPRSYCCDHPHPRKGVISIQSSNVVDHIICNILYELVNEVGYVNAMGKGSTLFKFLHLLVRAAKPKMKQRINKKA